MRQKQTAGQSESLRKSSEGTGIIPSGALLTVDEARRRLGLGEWAWRTLRRKGLPILRISNRAFVLSDQLIAFVANTHEAEDSEEGR